MIIRPATDADIAAVCAALRPHDAAALAAVGQAPDAFASATLARRAAGCRVTALCADDGAAAALVILGRHMPGVGAVARVATARWPEIARAAVKWWTRTCVPEAFAGLRVVTCEVLAADGDDLRFMAALGFVRLEPSLPLGVHGEHFHTFAWINPEPR